MRPKKIAVVLALVAVPVALYFVLEERASWLPRRFVTQGIVRDLMFSPDGSLLAIGREQFELATVPGQIPNNSGRLELWDVRARRPTMKFSRRESSPVDRVFFANATSVFYLNRDMRLRRWNFANRHNQIFTFLNDTTTLSPTGRTLAMARGGTIELYDASTRKLQKVLKKPPRFPIGKNYMDAIQFSRDGTVLCARAVYDSRFEFWDVTQKKYLGGIANIEPNTTSTERGAETGALSPDGKLFVFTDGLDDALHLYQVSTRAVVKTLRVESSTVYCLVWSPDGKSLAVGNLNGNMMLWDVPGARLMQQWREPGSAAVDNAAFSPDGRILVWERDAHVTLRRVR